MAKDVFMKVFFRDARNLVVAKDYRLLQTMADDGSNFVAAVMPAAAALEAALDVLTCDHIDHYLLSVQLGGGGAAANAGANNSVEAFNRCLGNTSGKPRHFIVPAWDFLLYTADENGTLDAAYVTAAGDVVDKIVEFASGEQLTLKNASNRATKRGQRGQPA